MLKFEISWYNKWIRYRLSYFFYKIFIHIFLQNYITYGTLLMWFWSVQYFSCPKCNTISNESKKINDRSGCIVQHIVALVPVLIYCVNKLFGKLDNVGHNAVALGQKIPIRQGFLRKASPWCCRHHQQTSRRHPSRLHPPYQSIRKRRWVPKGRKRT